MNFTLKTLSLIAGLLAMAEANSIATIRAYPDASCSNLATGIVYTINKKALNKPQVIKVSGALEVLHIDKDCSALGCYVGSPCLDHGAVGRHLVGGKCQEELGTGRTYDRILVACFE